jgi:hypothetical protein
MSVMRTILVKTSSSATHAADGGRRLKLVYVIGVLLVLAATGDKYSYGERESIGALTEATKFSIWQVYAAVASLLCIVGVVLSASRSAKLALLLATVEALLFATTNALLYERDGYLRFVDWDYGHSASRLYLAAISLTLRAVLLWQLARAQLSGRGSGAADDLALAKNERS